MAILVLCFPPKHFHICRITIATKSDVQKHLKTEAFPGQIALSFYLHTSFGSLDLLCCSAIHEPCIYSLKLVQTGLLRTVRPFVIAQKFCASRDGSRNLGLLWRRLLRLRLHETRVEFHQPRSQDVKRRDSGKEVGVSSRDELIPE